MAASPAIAGSPCAKPADSRASRGRRPDVLTDPDSLRELVHEIKTPLNAIIGFAEIIEGQYLGPADRGYRERAAEIVRQARLLLAAIDDLDFAAKVHSSTECRTARGRPRRAGRARAPELADACRRAAASRSTSIASPKRRRQRSSPSWPTGCSSACSTRSSSRPAQASDLRLSVDRSRRALARCRSPGPPRFAALAKELFDSTRR